MTEPRHSRVDREVRRYVEQTVAATPEPPSWEELRARVRALGESNPGREINRSLVIGIAAGLVVLFVIAVASAIALAGDPEESEIATPRSDVADTPGSSAEPYVVTTYPPGQESIRVGVMNLGYEVADGFVKYDVALTGSDVPLSYREGTLVDEAASEVASGECRGLQFLYAQAVDPDTSCEPLFSSTTSTGLSYVEWSSPRTETGEPLAGIADPRYLEFATLSDGTWTLVISRSYVPESPGGALSDLRPYLDTVRFDDNDDGGVALSPGIERRGLCRVACITLASEPLLPAGKVWVFAGTDTLPAETSSPHTSIVLWESCSEAEDSDATNAELQQLAGDSLIEVSCSRGFGITHEGDATVEVLE